MVFSFCAGSRESGQVTGESVRAYAENKRDQWVLEWPGQVVIAVGAHFSLRIVSKSLGGQHLLDPRGGGGDREGQIGCLLPGYMAEISCFNSFKAFKGVCEPTARLRGAGKGGAVQVGTKDAHRWELRDKS